MDSLGIPFVLVVVGVLVLWCGLAILLGRILGLNTRLEEREQRADRFEVDGSWDDFVAECLARRDRAEARHGRRAA